MSKRRLGVLGASVAFAITSVLVFGGCGSSNDEAPALDAGASDGVAEASVVCADGDCVSPPPGDAASSGECSGAMASAMPFARGDGSAQSPFGICTVTQWLKVNEALDKSFVLLADLDFSANAIDESMSLEEVRIGRNDGFSGTLDGRGHVISKLFISFAAQGGQGLFTSLGASAEVKNLTLRDATVKGPNSTGLLAGSSAGKITNCHADGAVSGTVGVGGLVGDVSGGTVESSSSAASVDGASSVGGLVGGLYSGTIRRSSSAGTVRGSEVKIQNNGAATGGLVGTQRGGVIEDSYSTAKVNALTAVGGLVGSMYGVPNAPSVVERSYFAGTVTLDPNSVPTYKGLGGLAGIVLSSTRIAHSFCAGAVIVTGGPAAGGGGLVGEAADEVVDSYWDITRSGVPSCKPYLTQTGCTGVNAANAQPTYFFNAASAPLSAWDFASVWLVQAADFPKLR